jgi:hypothetical protein
VFRNDFSPTQKQTITNLIAAALAVKFPASPSNTDLSTQTSSPTTPITKKARKKGDNLVSSAEDETSLGQSE